MVSDSPLQKAGAPCISDSPSKDISPATPPTQPPPTALKPVKSRFAFPCHLTDASPAGLAVLDPSSESSVVSSSASVSPVASSAASACLMGLGSASLDAAFPDMPSQLPGRVVLDSPSQAARSPGSRGSPSQKARSPAKPSVSPSQKARSAAISDSPSTVKSSGRMHPQRLALINSPALRATAHHNSQGKQASPKAACKQLHRSALAGLSVSRQPRDARAPQRSGTRQGTQQSGSKSTRKSSTATRMVTRAQVRGGAAPLAARSPPHSPSLSLRLSPTPPSPRLSASPSSSPSNGHSAVVVSPSPQ